MQCSRGEAELYIPGPAWTQAASRGKRAQCQTEAVDDNDHYPAAQPARDVTCATVPLQPEGTIIRH